MKPFWKIQVYGTGQVGYYDSSRYRVERHRIIRTVVVGIDQEVKLEGREFEWLERMSELDVAVMIAGWNDEMA